MTTHMFVASWTTCHDWDALVDVGIEAFWETPFDVASPTGLILSDISKIDEAKRLAVGELLDCVESSVDQGEENPELELMKNGKWHLREERAPSDEGRGYQSWTYGSDADEPHYIWLVARQVEVL